MSVTVAQKIGMTQIFAQTGQAQVVTVLKVPDVYVTQVKTQEKDGYSATQIGYQLSKHNNQATQGRLKKAGIEAKLSKFIEITDPNAKLGDLQDIEAFKSDDLITIIGTTKGKGFAGTIKRHKFNTGPKTHGSHNYRQPGSIGSGYPERVVLGKKMAGHMGVERFTLKGLKIVSVSKADKTIVVNGPIPGPRNSYVVIRGLNA